MSFPEIILIEAAVLAVVSGASIAIDRRYRARRKAPRASWQRTQERFTDPATGQLLEVWYDPQTGERDYRPATPNTQ